MEVSAWNNGGVSYGIRVGKGNRDRFFNPTWNEVDLDLDGHVHRVALTSGFWDHCPEIRSPIIRDWMKKKKLIPWPKGAPPRMELTPVGQNCFKLTLKVE
jgi:hypothetical protein